jgi:hypothetical protein
VKRSRGLGRKAVTQKRSTEEHDNQCEVIRWLDNFATLRWPDLVMGDGRLPFWATPNLGQRTPQTVSYMKAEGMRTGVLDLFFPIARGGYHGLAIEMKTAKGVMSEGQKHWAKALLGQRYKVEVCRSAAEAIDTIYGYLLL